VSSEFQYDVFLSHNAKDKPRVRRLAERLRSAGLRVWFDEWVIQPGDGPSPVGREGVAKGRVSCWREELKEPQTTRKTRKPRSGTPFSRVWRISRLTSDLSSDLIQACKAAVYRGHIHGTNRAR